MSAEFYYGRNITESRSLAFVESPYTNRGLQLTIYREGEIYRIGSGVDLPVRTNTVGSKYERRCLDILASGARNQNNTLLIGPNVIDHILSRAVFPGLPPGISTGGQPDAMYFENGVLTEVIEAKTRYQRRRPRKKLQFIRNMLKNMREHPEFVATVFKESMPSVAEIFPDRFIIPPDNEIAVFFVSPKISQENIFSAGGHGFAGVWYLPISDRVIR